MIKTPGNKHAAVTAAAAACDAEDKTLLKGN